MRIGVISDTHISSSNVNGNRYILDSRLNPDFLYEIVEPYFRNVDCIIHAGDITDLSVIAVLKKFGDVYAVAGNMDSSALSHELGTRKILELGKFRIGVMHGWGGPDSLSFRIRQEFREDKVDCIVFGHSHHPYDRIEDGILMFNPGSPTDRRFAPSRNIGILHLDDKIWGEHIALE